MSTTEQKLGKMFLGIWDTFLDAGTLDGFDLQNLLEKSELTEWREATEAEADAHDMEPGEPMLVLNDEGKRIVQEARDDSV